MKEFKKAIEREYIETITELKRATDNFKKAEIKTYTERYKQICETIAMIYMKEHGYFEMPEFGFVPEFEYDNLIGEYVVMDNYRKMQQEENPAAYQLKCYKLTVVFKGNEEEVEYYREQDEAEAAKEEWLLQDNIKKVFIDEIIKSSEKIWDVWEEE